MLLLTCARVHNYLDAAGKKRAKNRARARAAQITISTRSKKDKKKASQRTRGEERERREASRISTHLARAAHNAGSNIVQTVTLYIIIIICAIQYSYVHYIIIELLYAYYTR